MQNNNDNFKYLKIPDKIKYLFLYLVLGFLALVTCVRIGSGALPKWIEVGNIVPLEQRYENNNQGKKYRAPVDALLRYSESTHFLQKNNPFDVINGKIPQNEEYIVSTNGGTAPWAFVLGLPFAFPFLPFKAAIFSTLFLYVAITAIACAILFKFGKKNLGSLVAAALLPIFYLVQKGFAMSLEVGNHSIIIYAILIVLAFSDFFEKRPIIGGIILGISMIKPHMMMLFFLPLLFRKQFLLIGVAVATVVAAWIFASFWVGVSALELLRQCEAQGAACIHRLDIYMGVVGSVGHYLGFTDVESISIQLKIGIVLFGTIAACIAYAMRNENKIYSYAIMATITVMWTYGFTGLMNGIYILVTVPIFISLVKSDTVSFVKLVIFTGALIISLDCVGIIKALLFMERSISLFEADIYRVFLFFAAVYTFYDAKKQSFYKHLQTVETKPAKNTVV